MKTQHRVLNIATALILFVISPLLHAQTYIDMHDFNNSDGCCANYSSLLAPGADGDIYGATLQNALAAQTSSKPLRRVRSNNCLTSMAPTDEALRAGSAWASTAT